MFPLNILRFIFHFICTGILPVHVCVHHICAVPLETRRRYYILQKFLMCVLGPELGSSTKKGALNCGAMTPAMFSVGWMTVW